MFNFLKNKKKDTKHIYIERDPLEKKRHKKYIKKRQKSRLNKKQRKQYYDWQIKPSSPRYKNRRY